MNSSTIATNGAVSHNGVAQHHPVTAHGAINEQPQSYPALDARMDMYAAEGGFCPSTAMLAKFLQDNSGLEYEVFQVLDSLNWHFTHTKLVPSIQQFNFDTTILPVNLKAIQSYMVNQRLIKGTDAGVKFLEQLRPQGQPLPIVPAIPLSTPQTPVTSPASQIASHAAAGQQAYPPLAAYWDYDLTQLANMFPLSREHGRIANKEYEAANNRRGKRTASVPDRVAADLPSDDSSYRLVVNRVAAAMVDTSGEYLEKGKKKVKGPKQKDAYGNELPRDEIGHEDGIQAQRLLSKRPIVAQLAACKMVDAAMEAHVGNVNISEWSPLHSWAFEVYDTFGERIDAMVEALLISKAIPDNVMKVNVLHRFAAAPCREVNRKQKNKVTNQNRDEQNTIGIHAKKSGLVVTDANTNEVKNAQTGQVVTKVKEDVQELPATLKRGRGAGRGGKRQKGSDGSAYPTA